MSAGHNNITMIYSLGDLQQRMVGSAQLAQVQRHVGYLVAEQPPEAQERRRVADHLLGLGHHAVPVGSLRATVPATVRGGRGERGRAVRALQPPDGRGRHGGGRGARGVHVRRRQWCPDVRPRKTEPAQRTRDAIRLQPTTRRVGTSSE